MRGWRTWARPHGRIAVRPCVFLYPLIGTAILAVLNGSPVLFSGEEGEEGRGECVVGALGRARTAESPCVAPV